MFDVLEIKAREARLRWFGCAKEGRRTYWQKDEDAVTGRQEA